MARMRSVLLRLIGLACAGGLFWYGFQVQHADDVVVAAAYEHASTHVVDPSKAESGASLVSLFGDLFGGVVIGLGVVTLLFTLIPWELMVSRNRKTTLRAS